MGKRSILGGTTPDGDGSERNRSTDARLESIEDILENMADCQEKILTILKEMIE